MVGYSRDELVAGRLLGAELTPPEWRERDAEAEAELKMSRQRPAVRKGVPAKGWWPRTRDDRRGKLRRERGPGCGLRGRLVRAQAGRREAESKRVPLPNVRRPRDRRVFPARRRLDRHRRQPSGLREPRLQPRGADRNASARLRWRSRRRGTRDGGGSSGRRTDGDFRDAPPAQGRDRISGRNSRRQIPTGRAMVPSFTGA